MSRMTANWNKDPAPGPNAGLINCEACCGLGMGAMGGAGKKGPEITSAVHRAGYADGVVCMTVWGSV